MRPRPAARVRNALAPALAAALLALAPAPSRGQEAGAGPGFQAAPAPVLPSLAAPDAALADTLRAGRPRVLPGPAVWAGSAALLGGALLLDRELDGALPDGGGTRLEPVTGVLNHLGRPHEVLPVLAGTYAVGRLADRPALAEGAAHVTTALLVAGVVSGGAKFALGRERPATTGDPHRFRPFSTDDAFQAFPSGHTTVAFSLAAAVSEEAGRPWVTAAAYGTAALVGWSRVYDDEHWTSDVVGGALVGALAGRATVRWLHRREARGRGAGPALAAGPGGVAISFPTR